MTSLVEVESLSKKYGKEVILEDINFTINQGDKIALIGKNGSGKTTLLNIITKLQKETSGKVIYNLNEKNFYMNFGIQMQDGVFDERLTIHDYCLLLEKLFDVEGKTDKYLKDFELEDKRKKKINTLSGGEKQKFNIICALLHDPEILIFDEVSTGLDTINRSVIKKYIKKFAEKKTLIIVSHYMEEIEQLCERVICINNKHIIVDEDIIEIRNKYGSLEKFYVSEIGGQ